ncbi:spermidine/putrescine-binding periplasmic protein 1 [Glaesserella parasuis 29755]|uniref:Spermidine/putrescine ABC transporter substrate-binding protein n=3 Tax=Glaesserella parasuis TaxID=738 RepID=A0A837AF10_GLAPU|nr:protein PotD [Glaesserella parasuis ZJ0906]AIK18064.1 hypothetical protein JL26_10030 [Glaesserella parasuis]ATW44678.1 hypothetical protein A2U21_01125 [Glaesserella parasuis str. Nagasaki]EMY46245.1 protein PotD [Glaesserella parasuis gx033]EQA07828.1 potD domain protein [Glaesserella parasuis 84-15995]EQA95274.1 spermidine/putrescine ABC transporter periplasmic substrate-binding protein [Glaesserella parasuis 29755]KDB45090.1 hypothetical protein HPS9_08720 [Glaesserella parasuis HPS9]
MKKWAMVLSAVTLAFASHQAVAKGDTAYLYTWSEYVPEGLLDDFTKQTGLKVIVSSLESIETMYAKLKTMGMM